MHFRYMMKQLCRITKRFVAPFAGVNGISGVEEHVLIEIRLLAVRLVTIGASKLLLTCVHLQMHGQTGCLCKCFIAIFTFKWFFTRVNSHVSVKTPRLSERFLANATLKRFIARVMFHVLH